MAENGELSREEQLWQRAKEFEGIPRAESYHELSKIEYDRENYKEALSMCLVAKEIYEGDQVDDHCREIIDIYEGLASIYECLEDCDAAEKSLLDAISIARKNDSPLLADLLRSLGRMHFEHKKWEESIAAHSEANQMPDLDNDEKRSRGVDFLNIGMAYERQEKYAEAVQNEKKALDIFITENAAPQWGINTHAELAASYSGLKLADEILYHGQIALDWFATEENYQKMWVLNYYLAIAHRLNGDLDRALNLLNYSRDIAKEHCRNFHIQAADIDKEIGEIFIIQGKVESGQELIRRAASVQKSIENKHEKELPNEIR